LTTDGLRPYLTGVEEALGANIDYGQLVKLYGSWPAGSGGYAPPRVAEVIFTKINGYPDERYISTSYVERHNLSILMQIRRFTQLTNAFRKQLANLKANLALHFAWYNLCRVHATLRVTPTMATGISSHVWSLEEVRG